MNYLATKRLILRAWQQEDLEPMCELNQDPKVMEYFPSMPNRQETIQLIEKINQHFKLHGFGFFCS